ncbi:ead/Ea22-like family protein, partial [Klebsiella pneumoniae]
CSMTDITELAQSLKNAASKALIEEGLTWFSEEQLSHEDGIALHKADAEFIALANPANVLALVEALEKAQQQMTESENRVRKQNRHICELFDDNTALRQRIAGLEARTVKLPDLRQIVSGDRYVWSDGVYNYSQDVKVALAAAGIKVEIE